MTAVRRVPPVTREVVGVRRVESLLHLPGQPAPMHH